MMVTVTVTGSRRGTRACQWKSPSPSVRGCDHSVDGVAVPTICEHDVHEAWPCDLSANQSRSQLTAQLFCQLLGEIAWLRAYPFGDDKRSVSREVAVLSLLGALHLKLGRDRRVAR